MDVLRKVDRQVCWDRTGRAPLAARWIDHDKGLKYRSRWVAKQFKNMDSDEWFAATAPIEALRAIISNATTGVGNKGVMVNDVSRAFFYVPVKQDILVELCQNSAMDLKMTTKSGGSTSPCMVPKQRHKIGRWKCRKP